PVEIVAVADARHTQGFERVEHRARPDRHAGSAQRAREVEEVLGKPAVSLFTSPACGGGRTGKVGRGIFTRRHAPPPRSSPASGGGSTQRQAATKTTSYSLRRPQLGLHL